MLIKVLSLQREYVAVLENAYSIGYDKKSNQLWTASFKLPLNDPKNEQVQHFRFVELWETDDERDEDYIGLFQIMPKETNKNTQNEEISYECTHVLRTLMGKSLFKFYESVNNTTKKNLQDLLAKQDPAETYWKLGSCEFERYFSYSFENENLLAAILSIPKPFEEAYRWTWNTRTFPWVLNLVKQPSEPVCRLMEGHNLVGFKIEENPNDLFNRIYPLGAGEGVNQLDIRKINGGKPYVENKASIAKYGLQEFVWADKRFTIRENLKSSAEALLAKWSRPIVSWDTTAAYLYQLTGDKIDKFREGEIVRVVTNDFGEIDLRICREKRQDIDSRPGDIDLELGDVREDLGTTAADIERRQKINELYSQGATNVLNYDKADNCDANSPVKFRIFIDDDVVNINTCELTFETSAFRAYSKAIQGGGAIVASTKGGGATVNSGTTESGGQYLRGSSTQSGGGNTVGSTSQNGGGATRSSSFNGRHRHIMFDSGRLPGTLPFGEIAFNDGNGNIVVMGLGGDRYTTLVTAEAADDHYHNVSIPEHTHNFSVNIPAHTHEFNIDIPSHKHEFSFTLKDHTHEIELPNHKHEIEYGIFEDADRANKVVIKVDGNTVEGTNTSRERFSLIDFLAKNQDGTIQRGWHEIEMTPNKRARIEAQITMRVFIKSQLGGEF